MFCRSLWPEYPQFKPYFHEVQVDTMQPQLPVSAASRDYFSGRDPALEAVLQRIRQAAK